MIARGAAPQRSAFLSAFFALVGCHGLHVTAGLIWLTVMMAQVAVKGFRPQGGAPPALFRPVLARARHHLGRAVHGRLSDGSSSMTDAPYDRAPGETRSPRPATLVRRARLHDRIGSGRAPHRDVVLGRQHLTALGTRRALGACRPRHRTDGRSPGLLPAHHHRARTTPITCLRSRSACSSCSS